MFSFFTDPVASERQYMPQRSTIFWGPPPYDHVSAADILRFNGPWSMGQVTLPSSFKGFKQTVKLRGASAWVEPERDDQHMPGFLEALGPKFLNEFLFDEHSIMPAIGMSIHELLCSIRSSKSLIENWNNFGTASPGCPEGTQVEGKPDNLHRIMRAEHFAVVASMIPGDVTAKTNAISML